jgi:glycosyltransferase involved in cell wall biosynthesis
MKKIKVLQFPVSDTKGGVTQYALQNWRFIDKSKFQFDFATRSKSLDFAEEILSQGCKIHNFTCSSEENEVQFIKEINNILNDNYDVIHLHTLFWKGTLVEKIAMQRGCPKVIIHAHNSMVDVIDETKRKNYVKTHNYYRNLISLNDATNFCACSKDAANWLFGPQIPRERIQILNNAIDLHNYSFSPSIREITRHELNLDGYYVLGHIGRFEYLKNHDMLIDIFKEVYKIIPNARLMMVGGGVLEDTIRQKVIDYGLEKAVMFMGKRNDVPKLLQAMDLFLLPSRFEGLGLALVEAQAAGLKCITSKNTPSEVEITPNIIFAPESITEWVDHILDTIKSYKRKNTDKYILGAGYDLNTQIKVVEKLYAGEI